ncbi:MAG: histidine--tRNA ligase [Mycoplasmataceae bacterium]|nr:histidine--tRNA ligase [Mycoplasmataceae bacterium]
MDYKKPKGTKDIFNIESYKYEKTINILKRVSNNFNYEYIETPIFEYTNLFNRIGESSDIVSKEMYTFKDKSNRSLTLRPEGTASATRLAAENNLLNPKSNDHLKLFYIGDMFRYERPQSGRYRQFKQFGVELYSKPSLSSDIEVVLMINSILKEFNISNYKFIINSIGGEESRKKYVDFIKKELGKNVNLLSDDSKVRINSNPLRILDSKNKRDIELVNKLPSIYDFLSPEEKETFDKICKFLDEYNIKYEIDHLLVRGLDYYNDFVFEVVDESNSSRTNSILGGGRYSTLVKDISGFELSSVGFAIGIQRLINLVENNNPNFYNKEMKNLIYIAPLTEKSLLYSFTIRDLLIKEKFNVNFDLNFDMKMKYYFNKMDKLNPGWSILVGDKDSESNLVTVKNNLTKEIKEVKFNELKSTLTNLMRKNNG